MIPDEQGKMLDLNGEYLVTISTGPSYEDARSEAYDKLLELFKINPMVAGVGSDMLIRNMDFAESEKLADRVFSMLDPKIQQSESQKSGNPEMQLQMLQQKFAQSQKMIEQLTQTLNAKNAETESLKQKEQIEMQKLMQNSQLQQSKNETEIQKTLIQTQSDERIAEMEKQMDYMRSLLETKFPDIKNLTVEHHNTKNVTSINPQHPVIPMM